MPMLRDERLRQGSVEPFDLALHFRRPGIGVEMHDALVVAERFEMIRELRSVVGLHVSE